MRWVINSFNAELAAKLASQINVLPLISQLLIQRGISDTASATKFLNPRIEHLHSPYLMSGMKIAVERLRAAIERKEQILIYGDYDVDGTVAVVILKTAIEICGGLADFHVPHRIREGYGMKDEVIERAAAAGVRLIISVDTGIRAFAAAETAKRVGIDLIVTDHHLPDSGEVPAALAVLNPNQRGCGYPCKALCGAGVAFKVAQALLESAERERLLPSFLKMVAIATIADSVPLTGENRAFAKLGLEGLRHPVNAGLKALFEVASVCKNGKKLNASDVAFRIAPRLNAAGRMDVAHDVVELFTVREEARARAIALRLNQLNSDRQQEEALIVNEIQSRLDGDASLREPYCLVLDGAGWHRGVIGIVATRVVERYHRPTLVIARNSATGEAHGSGRSIANFHLLHALEQESCRHLFIRFGGHAHAVGFSLPCDRIEELRAALNIYAHAHLSPADFEPVLEIDAEVSLDQLTPELLQSLELLEPFGQENREPLLILHAANLLQPPKILKEKHLKLRISSSNGAACNPSFDALGWRMAGRVQSEALNAGDQLDLAFILEENSHPDFGGLQLVLRDYRKSAVVQKIAAASAE